MNIVIVNGSPRANSRTKKLNQIILKKHDLKYIDLSEMEIPFFDGTDEQKHNIHVVNWMDAIENAEAVIFTTPEYHGGMSGLLKNATDFLGSKHLKDKPVAIIATAGGGKGGINALNNLRIVLRSLYANVIAKQIVIDPNDFISDESNLSNEIHLSIDEVINQLKKQVNVENMLI
ncbi:NAD(P)H-dependent oxidoreductase [Bacillus sp. RG28]|uniref:NAD(P)H-dependent oxidoreductase n=1 Tax=Gottfriedia endophytica TaxID=2820819 RepID=A0A940NYB8_9BACI|nr:NAD(P)H-dependent oxidoreductase [Gottfriedia endophytica]MBP0727333.1 NAD(P)H-dependent oxidoreductase [Gottfriedia endophytica]